MKILVVSDSHGHRDYLLTIFLMNQDADCIIHLGDGARDTVCLEDVPALKKVPLYQVTGNCDWNNTLPVTSFETLGNYKFYITHGYVQKVKMGVELLCSECRKAERQVALFGHTHVPFYEERNGVHLFNPGAVRNGCYGIITVSNDNISFRHASL